MKPKPKIQKYIKENYNIIDNQVELIFYELKKENNFLKFLNYTNKVLVEKWVIPLEINTNFTDLLTEKTVAHNFLLINNNEKYN